MRTKSVQLQQRLRRINRTTRSSSLFLVAAAASTSTTLTNSATASLSVTAASSSTTAFHHHHNGIIGKSMMGRPRCFFGANLLFTNIHDNMITTSSNDLQFQNMHTSSFLFMQASSPPSSPPPPPLKQTKNEEQMTKDAITICKSGIQAVDPTIAIQSHIHPDSNHQQITIQSNGDGSSSSSSSSSSIGHTYSAKDYDEIVIIAFGKASSAMACATIQQLEKAQMIDPNLLRVSGVVIVKDDHATKEELEFLSQYSNVKIRPASHPVPDERSQMAATEIMDLLSSSGDDKQKRLVINCISGGGSALFCSPKPPLTLQDLAQINSLLLSSGMSIQNMNKLRKLCELGKGGGLVKAAYPSTCVTLVLSDVIGDPLDMIASGPSVPDESGRRYRDVWKLMEDYNLLDDGEEVDQKLPRVVIDMLQEGIVMEEKREKEEGISMKDMSHPIFTEMTKKDDSTTKLSETILVGNNAKAVTAAAIEAQKLGYNPVILGSTIEGEARDIAEVYVAMALQVQKQRTNPSSDAFPIAQLPAALIAGGETTVSLGDSSGLGGRNQEIGLVAAMKMREISLRDVVLASIGTDGTDGPTDAAGSVVDGGSVDRIESIHKGKEDGLTGEESLKNHDAYTFLDIVEEEVADSSSSNSSPLVKIGPTGTNVADICVTLIR